MESKISIIVPVYNCELYINKCIDSLISQTYKNIEIILIDDGSTDSGGNICDNIAKLDNRIKVIHKQNGGLSSARNVGMQIATGNYLMFVDSDDWVEKVFCERALYEIKKNNVSLVSFGLRYVYKDHCQECFINKPRLMNSSEAIFFTINDKEPVYNYVCNKIFSKSLFDDIKFPESYRFEDIAVMYRLFDKAKTIFVSDDILYNYLQRDNNITSTYNEVKSVGDRFKLWIERLKFLNIYYPEVYKIALKQATDQAVDILVHFYKSIELTRTALNFISHNKKDIKIINDSRLLKLGFTCHLF